MKIKKLSSSGEEWIRNRRGAKTLDDHRLEASVQEIVEEVRKRGNDALVAFTRKFDGIDLSRRGINVTAEDIRRAYENVSESQINALTYLKNRIAEIERYKLTKFSFSHQAKGFTISHALKPVQGDYLNKKGSRYLFNNGKTDRN